MNLKMVTWDLDYMQFLVNADTNEDAINRAIGINLSYAPIDDEVQFKDIKDTFGCVVEDNVEAGDINERDAEDGANV